MKVEDAMNKAVVVDEHISLRQAAKVMKDKKIGSVIVMKGNKVTGIITEGDVTRNTSGLGKKLSSVMSKNIISIGQKEDINHAAKLMAENKIKRLPVICGGELMGIITATDILDNSDALDEDFIFE